MTALEIQRARAGAIAREVVARSPEDAITVIFAGGSLARGEVWAAEIDGLWEIYSDVDIYVVVRDPGTAARVREVGHRVATNPPRMDGVHFLRNPDIGVYTPADLRAQPLRPGTTDLGKHHVRLYGDADVASLCPGGGAIEAAEALYLLENRMLELSEGGEVTAPAQGRLACVRALKARMDIHAAHALVAGDFDPVLAVRAKLLRVQPPSTMDASGRDDAAGAYRAAGDLAHWLHAHDDATRELAQAGAALADAWQTLARVVLTRASAPAAELIA